MEINKSPGKTCNKPQGFYIKLERVPVNCLAPLFTKVNIYRNRNITLIVRGNMSDAGWVKTHRKKIKWEWFSTPNTAHFFEYCLLKATHRDMKYKGKNIPRGSFWFGRKVASSETGLSERNIRTAISHLISTNDLTIKTSPQGSIINVINWDKYQLLTSDTTNDRPTTDQRPTTYKNVNNVKNVKKSVCVTPDEVRISWNKFAHVNNFKQCVGIGSGKHLNNFLEACNFLPKLKDWEQLFQKCASTDFLNGKAPSGWKASFTWLCDYDNALKVLNGDFESGSADILKWENPGE